MAGISWLSSGDDHGWSSSGDGLELLAATHFDIRQIHRRRQSFSIGKPCFAQTGLAKQILFWFGYRFVSFIIFPHVGLGNESVTPTRYIQRVSTLLQHYNDLILNFYKWIFYDRNAFLRSFSSWFGLIFSLCRPRWWTVAPVNLGCAD